MKQSVVERWSSSRVIPFLVLCVGLLATAAATFYVAKSVREEDAARFQNASDHVYSSITERISTHIALLRGGASLVSAREQLSPEEFEAYTTRLQLRKQYPTLEALALAPAISRAEKEGSVRDVEKALKKEFNIHPPGDRPVYFPLLYVAPSNSPCTKAVGFDLFTEENHYTAMSQARDTGNAAASAKALFVGSPDQSKMSGFYIFVPVYHGEGGGVPPTMVERRRQLAGFIIGIFRADDLFSGLMHREVAPLVHFKIHDGRFPRAENLLYRSPTKASSEPRFVARQRFDLPGHIWTLQLETTPYFDSLSSRGWAVVVCGFGVILSLALFVTTEALRCAKVVVSRSNAELESLVQERTSRLQEMVSDIDHFTYSITHDMRAPLRAMQGYAQLLLLELPEENKGSSRHDYLRRIIGAAVYMDKLILDALDFTRAIRQEVVLGPIQPAQVLQKCIQSSPAFRPPQAEVNLIGDFPEVWGNEVALSHCFTILLENAVKFVHPGIFPKVTIWSETRHARVTIFIQDNGIGIAPEHHQRIFGMFQRLHPPTEYPGTGIGLAILRKTADRMGAQVAVKSEPGQGSTFSLTLKMYEAASRGSQDMPRPRFTEALHKQGVL